MYDEKATVVLDDLCIGYKTRQGVKLVAEHLSATIMQGQLTCLMGDNGVGKSTLLRTLSAFQPPLGGSISIIRSSDEGNTSSDDSRLAPIDSFSQSELARTIGVVLTEKPRLHQMTALELVELGRSPYTGFWGRLDSDDNTICHEAMNLIGIDHLKNRMVDTLSDGERQKVMIAKALAQQTPIIFLDEPTAFLDYPSKVETLLLLKRISRESRKTVFLSTHDLELSLQVADTIWLMTRDNGVKIGSPQALAQCGDLSHFIERGEGISFDTKTLSVHISR